MKVTRLHILEHPFLHGKPASDPPVHVIWEPHEFDYWEVDNKGDLFVGRREHFNEHGEQLQYVRQVPLMIIQHGMYAKAWQETEEYPDAVASVPVPDALPYEVETQRETGVYIPDPLYHEDGPELAPWDNADHFESEPEPVRLPYTDADTGEHGELLIARSDFDHLEDEHKSEVEVVRVGEPDNSSGEIYTNKMVINADPIQYVDLPKFVVPKPYLISPTSKDLSTVEIPDPLFVDVPKREITEHDTHIAVEPLATPDDQQESFDGTEMGLDDFTKQRPGYGWPSGSYKSLADPTTEFKVPTGNTFFDVADDLPAVPEVFTEPAPRNLNETRIDLPRFMSPEPKPVDAEADTAPKE